MAAASTARNGRCPPKTTTERACCKGSSMTRDVPAAVRASEAITNEAVKHTTAMRVRFFQERAGTIVGTGAAVVTGSCATTKARTFRIREGRAADSAREKEVRAG